MNVEEAVGGSGCVMVKKLGSMPVDVPASFVSVMNNRCRDFNRIFVLSEDWRTMAIGDTRFKDGFSFRFHPNLIGIGLDIGKILESFPAF